MLPKSETPLSDLMAQHGNERSDASFAQLLKAMKEAPVGIIAFGVPKGATGEFVSTAEHPVTIAIGRLATGEETILGYADPPAFEKRYGRKFNAIVSGEVLISILRVNPNAIGIQINSALTETSILFRRQDVAVDRKPWWKFW